MHKHSAKKLILIISFVISQVEYNLKQHNHQYALIFLM